MSETGQSNLSVHAESSSLDTIGALVGQPVAGIASGDFALTGNAREMQARGHINGANVAYGATSALCDQLLPRLLRRGRHVDTSSCAFERL